MIGRKEKRNTQQQKWLFLVKRIYLFFPVILKRFRWSDFSFWLVFFKGAKYSEIFSKFWEFGVLQISITKGESVVSLGEIQIELFHWSRDGFEHFGCGWWCFRLLKWSVVVVWWKSPHILFCISLFLNCYIGSRYWVERAKHRNYTDEFRW